MEYVAYLTQSELGRHGIRPSTNRPKQCTDNAHTEPFFHTLKTELVHLRKFENDIEAVAAIVEFYNRERLHSGIGYQSPASYVRALG